MRRFEGENLPIGSADNTAGTEINRPGRTNGAVQAGGVFAGGATDKVQYTIDGTNWVDVGANINAVGTVREIPAYATKVRIFTVTRGAGTQTYYWVGYEELH